MRSLPLLLCQLSRELSEQGGRAEGETSRQRKKRTSKISEREAQRRGKEEMQRIASSSIAWTGGEASARTEKNGSKHLGGHSEKGRDPGAKLTPSFSQKGGKVDAAKGGSKVLLSRGGAGR